MDNKKTMHGNPHNTNKSNSVLLERCFRLIEYLKRNTDKNHTITQAKLRRDPEISNYIGSKTTFNNMMRSLAIAMNTDSWDNMKPEDEWRLVYRAFKNFYGENEDYGDDDLRFVKDIYYNHIFTEEEITEIITALQMSKMTDNETAERIIHKIKKELVSNHYKEFSCRIFNSENTDSKKLKENLTILQKAISLGKQISYMMNYYDCKKQLIPIRSTKKNISPHYIVTNAGRFYLIGCFENGIKDEEKKLCIIRIDLMSDITIENIAVTPKHHIRTLPQIIKNEFKSQHLSMSYDEPIYITIRITKRIGDNINHTFIHDSFGDDYSLLKSDSDGDIIKVRCSEFGVVNWALQYSDCVEIIEPTKVKEEIKQKIKVLNEKYF